MKLTFVEIAEVHWGVLFFVILVHILLWVCVGYVRVWVDDGFAS